MINYFDAAVTLAQATFCGGIAYSIAFKYQRKGSTYHFLPSCCAFALASLLAMQWMSIIARIIMYAEWPIVSLYNTLIFGILFLLILRSRGNVARMFDFDSNKETPA